MTDKRELVALFSTRNVFWQGVGKISFGYNIVSRDVADEWLTRNHVRETTPQEVLKEFGN